MLWKIYKKIVLNGSKGIRDQTVIAFAVALFLFFAGSRPIHAEIKTVELSFKHQTLSAKIREAPLREVIETIEKKGIWFKLLFKGKESVLNEKVSVRFKRMPLKEGLERILSTLNHCLVFDSNGILSGVILLGKPARGITRRTRRIRTPSRTLRSYNRRRQ